MMFVVDAQLPPALARMISELGHEAEHLADIGLRDPKDSSIWDYAMRHHAIVITKDEDFPHRFDREVKVRYSFGCGLATQAVGLYCHGFARYCRKFLI